MIKNGLIFILLLFFSVKSFSQCCSAGNPSAGTTNVGIVDKKAIRFTTFYRHSFSDKYYSGSELSDKNAALKSANFNYVSLIAGYGILARLTAEVELGYFINKTQHYTFTDTSYNLKGNGFANGLFSLKYNFFTNKCGDLEYTAGAGFKFPFNSNPQYVSNVELPVDIQPSTNAKGVVFQSFLSKKFPKAKIRLILVNRYEINGKNTEGYKFGNILISSLFVSRLINDHFTAILQVRNDLKSVDLRDGTDVVNTGNNLLVISPQINYTFYKKWNLSGIFDVPVYRYYKGTQFGNKYAFAILLSHQFKL